MLLKLEKIPRGFEGMPPEGEHIPIVFDALDDELLIYSARPLSGLAAALRRKLGSEVSLGWKDAEAP